LSDFPSSSPRSVADVETGITAPAKAFANAVGLGLSVEELTPCDPKACEELATLASIVFGDVVNIKISEKAMK
jgi:hypothetical protein